MTTTPASGGISSVQLSSVDTTVVVDSAPIRSIDLRTPASGADGATWAVFTFFFLFLLVGVGMCAVLVAGRLRRARAIAAVAVANSVKSTQTRGNGAYDSESLSTAA